VSVLQNYGNIMFCYHKTDNLNNRAY